MTWWCVDIDSKVSGRNVRDTRGTDEDHPVSIQSRWSEVRDTRGSGHILVVLVALQPLLAIDPVTNRLELNPNLALGLVEHLACESLTMGVAVSV